jgi:hypothetical protein
MEKLLVLKVEPNSALEGRRVYAQNKNHEYHRKNKHQLFLEQSAKLYSSIITFTGIVEE